jgi:hypothetical protein
MIGFNTDILPKSKIMAKSFNKKNPMLMIKKKKLIKNLSEQSKKSIKKKPIELSGPIKLFKGLS